MDETTRLPITDRILFKAKTIDGEIVQGSLVLTDKGEAFIIPYGEDPSEDRQPMAVDQNLFGQRTGFVDYNEEPIYAGDTFEFIDEDKLTVVWCGWLGGCGIFGRASGAVTGRFKELIIDSDLGTPILASLSATPDLIHGTDDEALTKAYKFRGETPDGKMIYGSAINVGGGAIQIRPFDKTMAGGAYGTYIRPETLAQYTRQDDANGKEIYEGDEILDRAGGAWTVEWGEGAFWVARSKEFPGETVRLANSVYLDMGWRLP